MENIKQQLLNLLEVNTQDEEKVKNYLESNRVDTLFKNYKDLDVSEDAKEQIESLKVILENFDDK